MMPLLDKIAPMKNPVQEYAWGSRTAIPSLLGLPVPSERPAAELWMGAHPKAPSQVRVGGAWQPLDQVIERDPAAILGQQAARQFSNNLPFLFKVLAADHPLSIQVHPNLDQARAGFERENQMGIALGRPDRNYRDPSHKPEILCAVTRFEALKGFRPIQDLLERLEKVCGESLSLELGQLRTAPNPSGLREFFASLLTMDTTRKKELIQGAVDRARPFAEEDRACWWMLRLHGNYPGDLGILSPLLFHLVILDPGEALYVPAGQLHAYLQGMGMELMANSDNVVRGGLTSKHVDVPELLRIVDFTPAEVQKIRPRPGQQLAEKIYDTPAREFQLSVLMVSDGVDFVTQGHRTAEILICMEGEARVRALQSHDTRVLEKGDSVFLPAVMGPYQLAGKALVYRARSGGRDLAGKHG